MARNIFQNKVRWKERSVKVVFWKYPTGAPLKLPYFLLGAALKIPGKGIKPVTLDGFLDETGVQRALLGCVLLLSLSHRESRLVELWSSSPRTSRLVLALKAAWRSVTESPCQLWRLLGKSMGRCLAALPLRESSQERAALFQMAPYLAPSSSDPKSSPFKKTVLPPVILRII